MTEPDIIAQAQHTIERRSKAERAGDTQELNSLLEDDFAGIGPHGFQLDKQQWLDRYASGSLLNEAFATDEVTVRSYGAETAIVTGVQSQQATYQGHAARGRFRLTAVLIARSHRWSIADVQLSPIAGQ
ncbi:MAG: nuclear transport factor 2 family protein [Nocardioides sp.]